MQDTMMRDPVAGAEACEPATDSLGFPHNTLNLNREGASPQLVSNGQVKGEHHKHTTTSLDWYGS